MTEYGSGTAVPLLTDVECALIRERVSAVGGLLGDEGAESVVRIADMALLYAATTAREDSPMLNPEIAEVFDLIDESVTLQGAIVGVSAVAAILTVDEAFEQMKKSVDAK